MRRAFLALALIAPASLVHAACPALLDFRVPALMGGTVDLCQYQGKALLVVNTASQCGFTPQFSQLQNVWQQQRQRGVVVIGFPSDDFFQELDSNKDVASFCQTNYGVDFPMMSKTKVRGSEAHPFYQALAKASGTTPKWNFYKYVVSADGKRVQAFGSLTKPDDPLLLQALQQALLKPSP